MTPLEQGIEYLKIAKVGIFTEELSEGVELLESLVKQQTSNYYSIISEERGVLATIAEGENFDERLKTALEQNYDAELISIEEAELLEVFNNKRHFFLKLEDDECSFADQITLTPVSIY